MFSDEERSIKTSNTVLGDNPTYGGIAREVVTNITCSRVQPLSHYENTSTAAMPAKTGDRCDRSLTVTSSHSYEYVTSRSITGYRVNRNHAQNTEPHRQSTSSSVSYYSIGYTRTRWAGLGNQSQSVQHNLPSSSSPSSYNNRIPEHYETMENLNCAMHTDKLTLPAGVDPRSHYEFES